MNAINNDQENEVSKKKFTFQYQPFRAMQQTAADMSVIISDHATNG